MDNDIIRWRLLERLEQWHFQQYQRKLDGLAINLDLWMRVGEALRQDDVPMETLRALVDAIDGNKVQPTSGAVWLGEGRVCVDGETIKLEGQEATVLEALVELQAASM